MASTAAARKRAELLAATDTLLAGVADRVIRGTLAGAGEIGIAVGKAIGKYKMGKHFRTGVPPAFRTADQIGSDPERV